MKIKSILASSILLFSLAAHSAELPDSPPDSILYISGQEIIVTPLQKKPVTGLSVGKITLDPAAALHLPALLGNTDLLKLLELTPGIQNSGDANTHLYIRGGDPGHHLLLYNEIPFYTSGHLLGFFPLFNADHLAVLELHKTGVPARYGGRLGSVIDVRTKNRLPEKTSVQGNVGLLSSQATLQLPLNEKFALFLSGRKTYLNLLMQPVLNATVNKNAKNRVDGLDYSFYDVNFTLTGDLSEKDRVTVDAFFGQDHFDISEEDLLLNGNLRWQNYLLSAKWDSRIRNNPWSQRVYVSAYRNTLFTHQAEMTLDRLSELQDIGYQNSYRFSLWNNQLETGLQYIFHTLRPQVYSIRNVAMDYQPADFSPEQAHEAAVYLSSTQNITDQWKVDWGLRYNGFFQEQFMQSLEPRLLLQYRLNETTSFRAAYNRQNQYLNSLSPSSVGIPMDFWVAASRQIRPQSGNEFSAGYFQSFNKENFELSAEIFYKTMNHVNEYFQTFAGSLDESYEDQLLYGSGHAYGLELLFKRNYGRWTGWLSYTLARSERTFEEINQGKTFPARFDRRHDLSLVSVYTFNPHWDISLVYVYATGNAYTLPSSWYFINHTPVKEYGDYNSARMPDYNRMDLSVNYWYKKNNGINFSVYNVWMINNPVYIFMNVEHNENTGLIQVNIKQKKLYTLTPSVSWRFQF
ncbi:MAG: hypothetical protein LBN18_01820 [Dysgonamonadaceae bacterium]|jgi:hypothetical protein|nr:hypothetical protein [Dysgonamonadaceae bacterium]